MKDTKQNTNTNPPKKIQNQTRNAHIQKLKNNNNNLNTTVEDKFYFSFFLEEEGIWAPSITQKSNFNCKFIENMFDT